MAVDRDYMLKKPPGPSAFQLFVDTRIVPPVVNGLWDIEVALNRVSIRTRVRPAIIVGGVGTILSLALLRVLRGSRASADT